MQATIFNPSRVAVVYDVAGHVIGGGEWAEVNVADVVTSDLLRRGVLVKVDVK